MPLLRRRHVLPALLAAVLAGLLAAWLPALRLVEERSRDELTALSPVNEPVAGLLVVDIGESSLKAVGAWPWNRGVLADLVEQLVGPLGARAVALDMVLPEPGDAPGDARLASLAAHGPLTLAQVLDFEQRLSPITIGAPGRGAPASGSAPKATGFVANHAGLGGARCVGHIGVAPDRDGVLRRVHLRAEVAARSYATLSLALLECADPAFAQRAASGLRGVREGVWRIPFRRSVGAFQTVPAEAVLAGQVDRRMVEGRYVLIGSSAVGLSDYVATPMQPVTAGVLVHAQALSELLERGRGQALQPPLAAGWASVLATAAGLAVLVAAFSVGVRTGFLGLVVVAGLWLAACTWAFAHGLAPRVLAPLATLAAFALTWIGMDFAHSRRTTRRVVATLSHYVAEPVLKLLVKQGLERSLTPSRQVITVLVADMAGYTRLTAESTLEDSARFTTQFLELITRPVLHGGGTLDRYTGDGLIAFWGAPLAREDHAQCAFAAAQEMLAALEVLNAQRESEGQPRLAMRVGIESGEALVGDLGSSSRSVYTAVGTCINLASRLQELAREMGEPLVVGPAAGRAIGAPLRALGPHRVRGLPEPIELFGLPRTP